jgi:hypothetical protein
MFFTELHDWVVSPSASCTGGRRFEFGRLPLGFSWFMLVAPGVSHDSTSEFHDRFLTHRFQFSICQSSCQSILCSLELLPTPFHKEQIKYNRKVIWISTIPYLYCSWLCNSMFFWASHGTLRPARKGKLKLARLEKHVLIGAHLSTVVGDW